MRTISIGTADQVDELRRRLNTEFRFLQEEGMDVEVSETSRGNLTFIGCNLARRNQVQRKELMQLFYQYIANAVSDVIVDTWEKVLLKKIIRTNYYYFDGEEQAAILGYAGKYLQSLHRERGDLIYKIERKSRILRELLDYFEKNDELVLEGFVTFRMKDYVAELEEAVERAVDDFLMEKEQSEFIRLLKYFVEVQDPRLKEVHVLIRPEGTFKILDAGNNPINNECLDEIIVELGDTEPNHDDILISALITIAPGKLTMHCRPEDVNQEGIQTILEVFSGRAELCHSCLLCRGSSRD